ncbi:uncharacterized protein J4E84_009509 [Alternaria hordeiaustralica]|uniref:uncharacterized protein n=1 Tax=Alternaria hordeiaustralica TaxID=1187925 RepID=UPI0020C452E9|nr:uncharacterized protein J4E84_009509 [Alternaria hordeiaustralica]KAI4676674.1 hypothetical protein J4E84_009509 [Alternaria hordeiaustralica]
MAPTTRSGSKRASGEAVDTKVTKKAKRSVKTAAKPAKKEEPASEAPQYFRFLDLSPELRNRVYEYAREDDSTRFAPRPNQDPLRFAHPPRTVRPWKYFALTHVCTQVRAEYRPLWVRDLRVAFSATTQLTTFLDTFLRFENEPKHMPKLIQEEEGLYPYSDDDDECTCPDFDMSQSEWEEFKHDQMEYTSDIPVFVHNTNEAWIKAVQENKVTVTCSFCHWSHHAIFKILYKDPVCETTADSQPAWDLMKQWGILDLPTKRGTDFIFAYEDKQTTEKDGHSMAHSVTRQIVFRKTPSKA